MQELLELEERGWHALATKGNAGQVFYASILRDDAVMLFPGGLRIEGRERILESLGSQPWDSFRIEDAQVLPLTSSAAAVVYKVTAQREGSEPYVALLCSTYVRATDWKLVVHQQTPV
jgi:hypothetical protein